MARRNQKIGPAGAKNDFTCLDLFCGAGGLSQGFQQAGFRVLVGQDYDEAAGKTFAVTHPGAVFVGGPIQDITSGKLLKAAGLRRGELDVLVGGPPCQGYSVYNHQRGESDPRARLFQEYLRIVQGIQPKWIVMENVTGLMSIANGKMIREILTGMGGLGYQVDWKILKAEEYGVPQERRRIIFIGTRTGADILFPDPTHGPGLRPFVTVGDAISDLPPLRNGEDRGKVQYVSEPKNAFQRMLRGNRRWVDNHSAARLSKINEERAKYIPPGGSWRDIPYELLPAGMRRARRCDHTKRYGRPNMSDLACTILTKCDVHWGAYFHPTQDRAISIREAARLQSFPDSVTFYGSRTDQYIQVGNAVPPLLGKRVAEAVLTAIIGGRKSLQASSQDIQRELRLAV